MYIHRCICCFIALGIFASDARAQLADEEKMLLDRRMRLDKVLATVRTDVTLTESTASTGPSTTRSVFLDEYMLLGQSKRVDNVLTGNRDGMFCKQYRKPGEAVFFTNELNQAGGKAMVEVRQVDDSVVQQDIRLIGLGIGTLRQPQRPPLMVIGANEDARRVTKSVDYEGAECTEIGYESGGVRYRAVLAKDQGYEPVLIEMQFDKNGVLEQHVSKITIQSVDSGGRVTQFPKRVEIRRTIGGVEKERILEDVEMIEFGRVTNEVFDLAALAIPVGHPVYDFRSRSQLGFWNGKAIEYPDNWLAQRTSNSSRSPAMLAGTIGVVLFLFALVVHKHIRSTHDVQ